MKILIVIALLLVFYPYKTSQTAVFTIFSDDLSNFSDWSWGGAKALLSTTIKQSGTSSLQANFPAKTGQWPGLYLHFKQSTPANTVKTIEIDVRPTVTPKLQLCLRDKNYAQFCLSPFGNQLVANKFSHLSISTAFFKGDEIQSLIIMTTDDSYKQTIYLDNIYLASDSDSNNNTNNNNSNTDNNNTSINTSCDRNFTSPIKSKGKIPLDLPNRFLIGLFLDDPNPDWMKQSNVPWDVQYRYLVKGWVNNWGWGNYDGSFAYNFFQKANLNGYIPAVQYYQMVLEEPWPNDESKFVVKLQNAATMKSYFNDFIIFMKQVKNYGKPVMVLMEGDGFAYCQIQSNGNPSLYAAISDTGIPELQGLPNTVYGFGLALLQIRKSIGAANAYMGIHISGWATQKDLFENSVTDPLSPEVDKIYNFLLPFGLNQANVVGQEFDFLVCDPLDRDSDFYRIKFNRDKWWDMSDSASISSKSFNRHIEFLRLFNEKSGKKWIVWQIPVGNSNSKNVANTNKLVPSEGFKDNRPEYFFGDHGLSMCHCKKYAEAGVYALLFGRGEGQQSNYVNDQYSDGQLFMKSRVKKNFYDLGGVELDRNGN